MSDATYPEEPQADDPVASGADDIDQIAAKVAELSDIVEQETPEGVGREKATELQRFWSWAALGIFVVMAILSFMVCRGWYAVDQEFREALVMTETNGFSQANMDLYTRLSDQAFERSWRIVDRLVMGGLMSLLTLIVGYIFGARRHPSDRPDPPTG